MSDDYDRLRKLAEDGDISVARPLLEAAARRNERDLEAEAFALVLPLVTEGCASLDALHAALEPLARYILVDDGRLPLRRELPSFSELPAPPGEDFDPSLILAFDPQRVLALRCDHQANRGVGLELMSDEAWLEHHLHLATDLFDLDARLNGALDYIDSREGFKHRRDLEGVCFSLPTFGGRPPSDADRPADAGSWEILSYDGDDVLVCRLDPRNRYIHGYDDYESGYE